MEIDGKEYEQLIVGRTYFRYRSLVFEDYGIRIGETLIEYPDNIRKDEESKVLIKLILAARVIIDTHTLARFLERADKGLCDGYNIFNSLPANHLLGTLGQFVGPMVREILKKPSGVYINTIPDLEHEEISLLMRLFEYKSKLAKFIEAETRKRQGMQIDDFVQQVKERLVGHFFGVFPDVPRDPVIVDILENEIMNSTGLLKDPEIDSDKIDLIDYDKGVKMGFKRVGDHYSQIYYSEGYNDFAGTSYMVRDNGTMELYLSFQSCPFPDVMTPLGQVYVSKCPVDHSKRREQ
jgi:hypothetical protein